MDLRPILIRYVLQFIWGEHLFFALGRGNILFHTPNVGLNCTDFLSCRGLVSDRIARLGFSAFSAARTLIIATSPTHIAVTNIVSSYFTFLVSINYHPRMALDLSINCQMLPIYYSKLVGGT